MSGNQVQVKAGLFVVTGLMMFLSSCVSSALMEPLEITIANIEMDEMTMVETTLVADVRIVNHNPESLNFNGTSCKLYLGGGKVGRGVSSESFVVDRLSSHIVKVIFHINNVAAIYRLHQIQMEGVADYKLKTTLFSEGSYGTKRHKTTYEGRLELPTKESEAEIMKKTEE